MSKFLYNRSGKIKLKSKDITEIFFDLKKGAPYREIVENFLFKTELEENSLQLPIQIPKHNKFIKFVHEYESFKDLFNYMQLNANNNEIIPFNGNDASLRG